MKRENKQFARILDRAIELLSRRKGWVAGKAAADKHGYTVRFYEKGACSFCVGGALALAELEVTKNSTGSIWTSPAVNRAANGMKFQNDLLMVEFNDSQKTKAPVLKKLRALRASLA